MVWMKKAEDEDVIKAEMAKALECEVEDLDFEDNADGSYTIKLGNKEYMVYDSYDVAERIAVERVKEDLETDPSMFTQSWLESHFYITETDKRLLSNDLADSQMDGIDDEDVIEKMNLTEEYEAETDESKKEEMVEKAKDDYSLQLSEEIQKELEDPIEYLVNQQGLYSSADELLKSNIVSIDYAEAAQDAVNTDGAFHFLGSYDGNYEELLSDRVYTRTN